ncbi:hypothetical protein SIID45300_02483 [Candidatus Magnetaquicoccaceae bacterium FCR-1]|uniref:Secreted protein n=2 Tax=Candidatus Magnetaquiglobus chichijimensis TaxID=3141448 RepID=A0ABQ0CB72_9PROT
MRKSFLAVAMTLGLLGAAVSVDATERHAGQGTIPQGVSKDHGMIMAATTVTKDPTQTATTKKVSTKPPKKKAAKKAKKKSSPASRMAPGVVK